MVVSDGLRSTVIWSKFPGELALEHCLLYAHRQMHTVCATPIPTLYVYAPPSPIPGSAPGWTSQKLLFIVLECNWEPIKLHNFSAAYYTSRAHRGISTARVSKSALFTHLLLYNSLYDYVLTNFYIVHIPNTSF